MDDADQSHDRPQLTLLNEARFGYLHGDPVTLWEPQELSTTYTRAGSAPFTIGESRSSDIFGRQVQFADTLSWSRGMHKLRLGGSVVHHTSGGTGSEPGQAVLGTFTFLNTTTAPFEQLTLADVQQYTQPVNYGITSYELKQWMSVAFVQDSIRLHDDLTIDAGLRYDRQTLTDATMNFAPRVGFGWHPNGDSRLAIRGGYGMYYTQIRANALASALTGGLDGIVTYTATPGQTGFPACLTAPCVPLALDPRTLPLAQQPARNITIRAGRREFYEEQFASYGLNFGLLPNYPDEFVNPRSQVVSVGAEREVMRGLFAGADYVHQHWTDLDRSVDLNAPTPFDRTAPGQTRTVAAANATRPIVPVNGGVRSVNVLMNLGVADYDGLQTQVSYRGNAKMYANPQLYAVEGDEYDRAGRQRNRTERVAHLPARRRGARPERRRSAAPRGDFFLVPPAVQPDGRHRDTAGVGSSIQLHDGHRQQRRWRQQRSPGRRRRHHPQVGVSRHAERRTCRCSSRSV